MRNKKQKDDDLTPVEQLEDKVDAMMDPRRDDAPPAAEPDTEAEAPEPEKSDTPEIDIFSDTKTAPALPGESDDDKPKEKPKKKAEEPEAELESAPELEPEAETEPEPDNPELDADETPDPEEPELDPEKSLEELHTDAAIDTIVKEDLDKVLEAEDAKAAKESIKLPKTFKDKLKGFFKAWWQNKWARYGTIFGILLLLAGLAAWPTSRYFALNTFGVRSSASLKIVDQSTNLPLKNVTVRLGTAEAKTDETGEVKLSYLRLGKQDLHVERVAFAPINKTITIGWGSNPLGDMELKATGAQYTFEVTDYLSGKPVKAEATSDDASAFSDKNGKIILTVEDPETETLDVIIKADEYRTEQLTFAADTKDIFTIKAVPDQPVVYVTKQSGKYDVYKMDIDGKNKQLLLEGTGRERQNMTLVASPDGTQAALVSSRGTKRDSNRYLLDTLTLINLKDGSSAAIDDAQSIRLIDWQGSRLVYSVTYAAPSAATGDRQRIIAYNTEEKARAVLANSDYFNGIASIDGYVYYAIAASDPNQSANFSRIKFDGSGKQVLLNKQVWTVQRTDFKRLSLQTPEGWYTYTIGSGSPEKGDPPAETYTERQYFTSARGKKTAWIENRDGKGVLLVREENASKDKMVVSASGVTVPVRWLNSSTITYRVANSNETADYVKSLSGGEAKKLTDVTPTSAFSVN